MSFADLYRAGGAAGVRILDIDNGLWLFCIQCPFYPIGFLFRVNFAYYYRDGEAARVGIFHIDAYQRSVLIMLQHFPGIDLRSEMRMDRAPFTA